MKGRPKTEQTYGLQNYKRKYKRQIGYRYIGQYVKFKISKLDNQQNFILMNKNLTLELPLEISTSSIIILM